MFNEIYHTSIFEASSYSNLAPVAQTHFIRRKFYIWRFLEWIILYKLVFFVCLFVCLYICPIINHEPLDRFALNLDWGTRENHLNILSCEDPSWVDQFIAKIEFPGKIGQVQVVSKLLCTVHVYKCKLNLLSQNCLLSSSSAIFAAFNCFFLFSALSLNTDILPISVYRVTLRSYSASGSSC